MSELARRPLNLGIDRGLHPRSIGPQVIEGRGLTIPKILCVGLNLCAAANVMNSVNDPPSLGAVECREVHGTFFMRHCHPLEINPPSDEYKDE